MEIQSTLFEADVSNALPTFDQIVQRHGGDVRGVDVSPNYRQDAELVVEPISGGLCVSVRDVNHQTLLSFIAGRSGTSAMTAQAAVLAGLRELIRARQSGADASAREEPRDAALAAVEAFKADVLDKIVKASVDTKAESRATRVRSAAVIDALNDARKLLSDRLLAARAASPEE
jgi:hypothetical protein